MGAVSLKIGDGTARFRRASVFTSASHLIMLFSVILTNLFAIYSFTSSPRHLPPPHPTNLTLFLSSPTTPSFDPAISGELAAFLHRHPLPLGRDSRTGITEMVSSLPLSCLSSLFPLALYMAYTVASSCPPAPPSLSPVCRPKRRCFAHTLPKPGLLPFPSSLWKPVHHRLLSPSLLSRGKPPDCFNMSNVEERLRFVKARGKTDFLAEDVVGMAKGGIRVAVDFAVGAGNFAAVMAEKGVTVVTVSVDGDAPYSEFIAARGLFPLFVSMDQRFPFFDGVFDMVHAGSELGGGTPEKMEFLMFDVDRILRPGGLLWVDNFRCEMEKKKQEFTRLVERFGYKKLRWAVGVKLDGITTPENKPEVYLSAVLQKPARV